MRVARRAVVETTRFCNRTRLSSCQWAVSVTGWNPLRLNSAGLPVPHQGTTCAWTSMAQVGASDLGHWQAFGSWDRREHAGICRADSSGGLSVSSRLVISRTLRPPGEGAPKKFEFSNFAKVCVLLGARSWNPLGFVIAPPILLPLGRARDGVGSAWTELCRSPRSLPGHDLPVPRLWGRVGADPIPLGARLGSNDRTVPWLQAADSISS